MVDASSNTLTYSGIGVRSVPYSAEHSLLLPHVLRWVQPHVPLIVMLREPGDRFHSAFFYYGREAFRNGTRRAERQAALHRAVESDIRLFSHCVQSRAMRECVKKGYHQAQQLVKGLYSHFLRDWLDVFPADQLLVLRLESYHADMLGHLRRVLDFLHLSRSNSIESRMARQSTRNQGIAHGSKLPAETRRLLTDFYAPHNANLVVLLNDSLYSWSDVLAPMPRDAPHGAPALGTSVVDTLAVATSKRVLVPQTT